MNKRFLLVSATLPALLFTQFADAAQKTKRHRGEKREPARLLGRFDQNRDGTLDAKEVQRVRWTFAALKSLDADKNGELSESEVSRSKVTATGKRAKKNRRSKR